MTAELEFEKVTIRLGERVWSCWLLVPGEVMPPALKSAIALGALAVRRGHCEHCSGRWWVDGHRLDVAHAEDCPAHRDRVTPDLNEWLRSTCSPQELADLRTLVKEHLP